MDPNQAFVIAGIITQPMWLLMIFLPNWKATRWLIDHKVIPIILAIMYAVFISMALISNGAMDFSSLASVMTLFTDPDAAVSGWIHYLCFDLLIGMWILDLNLKYKIHQLLLAPCLVCTFMLGPVGFLLFTIMTSIQKARQ